MAIPTYLNLINGLYTRLRAAQTGGADEADNLVALNDQGLIDISMLPSSIGGGGGAGSSFYRHVQGVAASTWTVVHNLGYKPGGVFVENSAHDELIGIVTHIDTNTLTINFFVNGILSVESGEAHIS